MKMTDQEGRAGCARRAAKRAETSIIRLSGIDGTRRAKCSKSAISRLGTESGNTTPFGSRILAPHRVEIRIPSYPLGARVRTGRRSALRVSGNVPENSGPGKPNFAEDDGRE